LNEMNEGTQRVSVVWHRGIIHFLEVIQWGAFTERSRRENSSAASTGGK